MHVLKRLTLGKCSVILTRVKRDRAESMVTTARKMNRVTRFKTVGAIGLKDNNSTSANFIYLNLQIHINFIKI